MNKELNILILEDASNDAVLIESALRRGGLQFRARRVETKPDFLFQLKNQAPDLILSDHGLPSFDGYSALAIARSHYRDIPFIFVTGALGEEVAIQAFEKGAAGYVLKHRLDTLVPSVLRALKSAEEQKKRSAAEAERKELMLEMLSTLHKTKTLRGLLPICSYCKKIRDAEGRWDSVEKYLTEHLDVSFTHGICPECADKWYSELPDMGSSPKPK